jgi:hypothetical protein
MGQFELNWWGETTGEPILMQIPSIAAREDARPTKAEPVIAANVAPTPAASANPQPGGNPAR